MKDPILDEYVLVPRWVFFLYSCIIGGLIGGTIGKILLSNILNI